MARETQTIHCNNGSIPLDAVIRDLYPHILSEHRQNFFLNNEVLLDGEVPLSDKVELKRGEFYFISVQGRYHKVVIF